MTVSRQSYLYNGNTHTHIYIYGKMVFIFSRLIQYESTEPTPEWTLLLGRRQGIRHMVGKVQCRALRVLRACGDNTTSFGIQGPQWLHFLIRCNQSLLWSELPLGVVKRSWVCEAGSGFKRTVGSHRTVSSTWSRSSKGNMIVLVAEYPSKGILVTAMSICPQYRPALWSLVRTTTRILTHLWGHCEGATSSLRKEMILRYGSGQGVHQV